MLSPIASISAARSAGGTVSDSTRRSASPVASEKPVRNMTRSSAALGAPLFQSASNGLRSGSGTPSRTVPASPLSIPAITNSASPPVGAYSGENTLPASARTTIA